MLIKARYVFLSVALLAAALLAYPVLANSVTDTVAPVTTDNAPAGFQNAGFIITLSCSDMGSGCKQTLYSLDGGAWQSGNALAIDEPGIHRVAYYSVDSAGNQEEVKRIEVGLDKTSPSSSVSLEGTPGANGWFVSDVVAKLSAVDDLAGVDHIAYEHRLPDGTVLSGDIACSTDPDIACGDSIAIDEPGVHIIEQYAVDRAGNKDDTPARRTEVGVDQDAPVSSADVSGAQGENGWFVSDVMVKLNAVDDVSRPERLIYRIKGDTDWQAHNCGSDANASCGDSLAIDEPGVHLVEFYAVDWAGNAGEVKTREVRVDKTSPQVTYAGPRDNVYSTSAVVSAFWGEPRPPRESGSGQSSGINTASATLSLNGGAVTRCEVQGERIGCAAKNLKSGHYEATVSIKDEAGNSGSAWGSFDVYNSGLGLPDPLENLVGRVFVVPHVFDSKRLGQIIYGLGLPAPIETVITDGWQMLGLAGRCDYLECFPTR